MIGSFHLTSKPIKNRIQVQILGLLIFELINRGYYFILGGDYNSHITAGSK